MKRLTKNEFINKANIIHENQYDYSKVEYVDNKNKVSIECIKHGFFEQRPNDHLSGRGCPKCANEKTGERCRSTKEHFICSSRLIHGDKYDYSKVLYVDNKTNVTITCEKHGDFGQIPSDHLNGRGCPKCGKKQVGEKLKLSKEAFMNKACSVHGDRYDYSKVIYVNSNVKIMIICEEHGIFNQKPIIHLRGIGCPKCGNRQISERLRSNKEDFINKAMLVHGDRYDYSKVIYVNSSTKVNIGCKKHPMFQQTPNDHLSGKGCPICNESKLEKSMRKYLNDNNISFEYQKRFPWLKHQSLDFYLPELNIGIECQGEQHFKPVNFSGKGIEWAENELGETQKRDGRKKELCLKHGIKVLYYNYDDLINPLTCNKLNIINY